MSQIRDFWRFTGLTFAFSRMHLARHRLAARPTLRWNGGIAAIVNSAAQRAR